MTTKRTVKKTATKTAAQTGAKTARRTSTPAAKARKATKHVGDVLGISRARVPASVPRATTDRSGNPKGIELPSTRRPRTKLMNVVGGVRGRGR